MTLIIADRIEETTTTTGTGPFTVSGAITARRTFSFVCAVSDTFYGTIEAVDSNGIPTGDWMTGLFTYSAANQITLTTLGASSTGSAISFAAGTKRIYLDLTASQMTGMGIVVGTTCAFSTAFIACSTIIPVDDTIPQNTEGDEILTCQYTPKFANSLLQIEANVKASSSTGTVWLMCALFKDSGVNALRATGVYTNSNQPAQHQDMRLYHEEISGSVSTRTYKMRLGASYGNAYANALNTTTRMFGGVADTYIKVTEIRQ